MGVGAAFVMPATLSILTVVFPAKERAGAISAWSAIAGVGIVLGPTLGGLLLAHFYWGSVFWVNVPLVAVAITAVLAVVPDLPGRRAAGTRLDIIGAVASAAAMLAIIDAVIEGPTRGWISAITLGELTLGAVLVAAFVYRELHVANPLIDVRVFRHRACPVRRARARVREHQRKVTIAGMFQEPGQGLSQSGPNLTCWTISCRLSPNRSASVTGPAGPSNR
jgi:MFS family permease